MCKKNLEGQSFYNKGGQLRENVPLAFIDASPSPTPRPTTETPQFETEQHIEQQRQLISSTNAKSVPIIVEDRSGPVTMTFQSLDSHLQQEDHSRIRSLTPCSQINKPAPIIPFYQAPEKLLFEECDPTKSQLFDRRSVSPYSNRAKSPAPGPPPNPLNSIRAPRLKSPVREGFGGFVANIPRPQAGSIMTGQSAQGQLISNYQASNISGSQSFVNKPEIIQQGTIGDMSYERRENESRMAEEKRAQMESKTTTQVGNAQIQRHRKAADLTKFPQHQFQTDAKFPTKSLLPSYDEPKQPAYVVPTATPNKVAGQQPGYLAQSQNPYAPSSGYSASSIQQQQKQCSSLMSSSSLNATNSLTNSSAFANTNVSAPSIKPPFGGSIGGGQPIYKPPDSQQLQQRQSSISSTNQNINISSDINSGGAGSNKGGAISARSAPKRGYGILNKAGSMQLTNKPAEAAPIQKSTADFLRTLGRAPKQTVQNEQMNEAGKVISDMLAARLAKNAPKDGPPQEMFKVSKFVPQTTYDIPNPIVAQNASSTFNIPKPSSYVTPTPGNNIPKPPAPPQSTYQASGNIPKAPTPPQSTYQSNVTIPKPPTPPQSTYQ
uniref:Uncharacterized protein n=1 Tax=Megaselia scalaris TaxID=36166 RepID=T1GHR2_MEGSC